MEKAKPSITVQWHLTTNCNNRCLHCYMYDEKTFNDERNNTLSDQGLLKVFESILAFEKKWDFNVSGFAFSGGDPLLRKNWFEFLSEIKAHGKKISIMGNPETLTDDNLLKLKKLGLRKFQMSLDGLEEMHDKFRSNGSFRRTVEAITKLEEAGIPSQIMFTLYPENRHELFPLIDFLSRETPLSYFYFDIGTSSGNANALSKEFDKDEIRKILESYLIKKDEIKTSNQKITIGEKSHLFSILNSEQSCDDYRHYKTLPVIEGCLAGWFSVAVLSDGTVLSCRRLPIVAGKMPEQSFEEIFLGSDLLKKMRRREYFSGCGSCSLYQYCRGCPAYVYGITGNPFAKHPLCFKDENAETISAEQAFTDPPITTSYREEADFISAVYRFTQKEFTDKLMKEYSFRALYLTLIENRDQIDLFLQNKDLFLKNNSISVSEVDLLFMQKYLISLLNSGVFNKKENLNILMGFVEKLKLYHLKN